MFIDGFSGGQMPPKSSIREIRINSNPFAAEFDRPGFGRIQILTRPGTNQYHVSGFLTWQQGSGYAQSLSWWADEAIQQ